MVLPRLGRPTKLDSPAIREWLAVLGITWLGFLVRLAYLLSADGFPIGDGGMFAAATEDLRANGYRIPEFMS
ncbi:MAG: hypothetical protein ABI782_09365, partial [Anaerolineaceae bacterium]